MLQAFIRALQPRRLREHICRSALSSLVAALDESELVEQAIIYYQAGPQARNIMGSKPT